jgi:hypothetical protein
VVNLKDLEGLSDRERLAAYQKARAEEEKEIVRAALAVPVGERTKAQHYAIAHSPFGTGNSHNF